MCLGSELVACSVSFRNVTRRNSIASCFQSATTAALDSSTSGRSALSSFWTSRASSGSLAATPGTNPARLRHRLNVLRWTECRLSTTENDGANSASARILAICSRVIEPQPYEHPALTAVTLVSGSYDKLRGFDVGRYLLTELGISTVPTALPAPSLDVDSEHSDSLTPAATGTHREIALRGPPWPISANRDHPSSSVLTRAFSDLCAFRSASNFLS